MTAALNKSSITTADLLDVGNKNRSSELSLVAWFEDDYQLAHTEDGSFMAVWRINPFTSSTFRNEDYWSVSHYFNQVLCAFPAGTCGQIIKHTHRGIGGYLHEYMSNKDKENKLGHAIAQSRVDAQLNAQKSTKGFFRDLSKRNLKIALEQDKRSNITESLRKQSERTVEKESFEGRYPLVSDLYIVFMWQPDYVKGGPFLERSLDKLKAAMGHADPDELMYKAYKSRADKFHGYCKLIEQRLSGSNFYPSRLLGQGLQDLLYRLYNPIRQITQMPPPYTGITTLAEIGEVPEKHQQIGNSVSFTEITTSKKGWDFKDTATGESYYARPVSLISRPEDTNPGLLLQALSGADSEGLICINFNVLSEFGVLKRLKPKQMIASFIKDIRKGKSKESDRILHAIDEINDSVTTQNINDKQSFLEASIHIVPCGSDEEAVERRAYSLQQRLFSAGHVENIRGDLFMFNCMPGNINPDTLSALKRTQSILSSTLADLCPLFDEYAGGTSPAGLMNNTEGTPVYVDFFGPDTKTGHALIAGATGTGKSFSVNNLLMDAISTYNPYIWMIDKGRSYESICRSNNGNYIELITESKYVEALQRTVHPTCINPLFTALGKDGKREMPTTEGRLFVTRLLAAMITCDVGGTGNVQTVTTAESNLIYQALTDFYEIEYKQNPTKELILSEFVKYLSAQNHEDASGSMLAQALLMFYGDGPFAAVFDGKLGIDWSNRFTVLETELMSDSPALGIVLLALFRQIDVYAKGLPRDIVKIVGVDEAWAALKNKIAVKALGGFYRELRKYGGGVWLISQSMLDFYDLVKNEDSDESEGGILINTSHFWLLSCDQSDYALAVNHLGFAQQEADIWGNLSSVPPFYSEIMYRRRLQSDAYDTGCVRLTSAPVPLWLATSDKVDFKMREDLTNKYHNEGMSFNEARLKAVLECAEKYPYGARYEVVS